MVFRVSMVMLLSAMGAGCTTFPEPPIKPWERQWLSQPGMLIGETSLQAVMDDHFYFSKEGTSGGNGFAGGGCGCN